MIALATPTPRLEHPVFAARMVLVAPLVALALGLVGYVFPSLWPAVLAADLWLLSYPHVASTFTRTAFVRDDVRAHRALLFGLPWVALGVSGGLVLGGGLRALNTVYFFAQTFHYARQSRGVHRALRNAAGRPAADPLADAVMYLVALWTLVHRIVARPGSFFGSPLWVPSVPAGVELGVRAAAFAAFGLWVLRLVWGARHEESGRDAWHHLHVLGHVALFVVSYVAIEDATRGWIAINVWHNAQYLLFVRAWNFRRFTAPAAPTGLLASLSRPAESAGFFAVCALIGALGYGAIGLVAKVAPSAAAALSLYLVLAHAVNFHHYTADAILWRAPRRA